MAMRNPVHPGQILKRECLEPMGLSVAQAAQALKYSKSGLHKVIRGDTGITPMLAIKLGKLGWSTPEAWMHMQIACDLAAASSDKEAVKVDRRRLPKVARSMAV